MFDGITFLPTDEVPEGMEHLKNIEEHCTTRTGRASDLFDNINVTATYRMLQVYDNKIYITGTYRMSPEHTGCHRNIQGVTGT